MQRIKEKFSFRIQCNRGRILLLGDPADSGFTDLRENIETAIRELGPGIEYAEISDRDEIRKYGVFRTPAVITEKFTVKSSGKIVEKNIIKEWIKALTE
jgi:hypothetical protein